jgi:hypothetical protein
MADERAERERLEVLILAWRDEDHKIFGACSGAEMHQALYNEADRIEAARLLPLLPEKEGDSHA